MSWRMLMPILLFYTFFVFAVGTHTGQKNAQTDRQTPNAANRTAALIVRRTVDHNMLSVFL